MKTCFRWACMFGVLALQMCLGQTQLGGGALSGVVTDPSERVIPDADIVVTHFETGQVRRTSTSQSGQFTVPVLATGKYTVRVAKPGFGTVELKDVTVNVGSTATVRVELKIGTVESIVAVSAQTVQVDTTRTAEVSLVDRVEIDNLPINGRRADQFALLAPGVSRDGSFGQLSYRGFSGVFNNFTVEGNDDNEAYNGEARGRTRVASNISANAVQEFQVGQSNFLPEFGRAAGGSINAVIRSGSNRFHSDGFYYFRNQDLSARDPLASTKPDEQRQQFGGSISGPLRQDKLFYFVNYDQQIRDFPLLVEDTGGVLTNGRPVLAGNPTPQQQTQYDTDLKAFNAGVDYLRRQFPNGGPGHALSRHPNQNLVLGKVDWLVNSRNTFTTSYNVLHAHTDNGVSSAAVTGSVANASDQVDTHTVNGRLTTALSPHKVNELRFQWSRDLQVQLNDLRGPSTSIGGFSFGRSSSADRLAGPDERRVQVVDNFSYILGSHAFKFGVEFNQPRDILDITALFQGSYSYTNALTFGHDLVNPAGGNYTSFSQNFGLAGIDFTVRDYAGFVQDQWKPRRNLTINYGLRYDYESLPVPQFPNPAIAETQRLNADRTNFGPRVGAAYDLRSNGKTVLRAGYGVLYGRTPNGTIDNALRQTGLTDPTRATEQLRFAPSDPGSPRYPATFSAIPTGGQASPPFVTRLDANFRRPRVQEVNVGIERQIAKQVIVSASYVYTKGDRLPITFDQNLIPPNFTRTYQLPDGSTFQVPFSAGVIRTAAGVAQNVNFSRPNPNFGAISTLRPLGEQWYNGLLVEARRRFAGGFQAHASYTLAKVENLSGQASFGGGAESAFGGSSVANQFDLKSNRGAAATAQSNRLVADAVWDMPFGKRRDRFADRLVKGFRLSGIFAAEAGRPYSAGISVPSIPFSTPDGKQYNGFGGLYGQSGLNLLPTVPRNSNIGDANYRLDLRVARDFHASEHLVLEIVAEGFNVFNRSNFTQFNSTAYFATATTATSLVTAPVILMRSTNFGTPSSDNAFPDGTNARRFQLALRFRF